VTNSSVRGFASTNYGINLSSTTSLSQVFLDHVTLINNGLVAGGGGILVSPASSTSTTIMIRHANVQNNGSVGIRFDNGGKTGAGIYATVDDSVFSADSTGMLLKSPTNANVLTATVTNSIFARNAYGVVVNSAYAPLFGGNTITDNSTGILYNGASTAISFGDNHLAGNVTDGTFTTNTGTK